MKYIKLFENFDSKNINIADVIRTAASPEELGGYFTFYFNNENLTLSVDHRYIYPNGDKQIGLQLLGNSLDRILSRATEKLESMGLALGKGDGTSHGRNAFKLISHPLNSHRDTQSWKFRLIL
jgi:hypothetical protein